MRPQIDRVVGLTGTPAPNGLCDIWSQIYLLDQGERLEKTITRYREKYFRPGRSNGQVVFDYKILDGSEKAIYQKISDICVSMKAEDYLELPPRLDHTAEISLPDDIRARYEDFEKTEVLRLLDQDGESPISAVNAAALSSKLLQFSNGAIYDADRNVHEIHDYKLEALEEIVEAANGEPVLIFYSFRHDIGRIKRKLRAYKPRELVGGKDIDDWNAGRYGLDGPSGGGGARVELAKGRKYHRLVRFDMVIGIVPASLRQAAQAGAIEAGTDLPFTHEGNDGRGRDESDIGKGRQAGGLDAGG